MTLDQLITELKKIKKSDPNAGKLEVNTEGCDCDGDVAEVRIFNSAVYLSRSAEM